ncbi:hypothetical protein TYRP_012826 [Tyrophagus putrescentiae]|nr:hypothetical protein TYRP_012826 [Tyrophagus putrescentiae]
MTTQQRGLVSGTSARGLIDGQQLKKKMKKTEKSARRSFRFYFPCEAGLSSCFCLLLDGRDNSSAPLPPLLQAMWEGSAAAAAAV